MTASGYCCNRNQKGYSADGLSYTDDSISGYASSRQVATKIKQLNFYLSNFS